ncbi:MAG: hypothetical protein ACI9KE_006012 [Polyangiales bacterium]|jgi:hypothetical protein
MKRAALPFALAAAGLLFVVLWQSSQGAGESNAETRPEAAPQSDVESGPSISSDEALPLEPGSVPAPEEVTSSPNLAGVESGEQRAPGPENQVVEQLAEESPTEESPTEERTPLKRYENSDALALRRARQIELVTQAQQQARASLEDAERSGDTEIAARTRGVIRRLQLRLDALETAASALEPY